MRLIMIVIECLSYEFLMKCDCPNIKSLDPHPAKSYGRTTRAAVGALLGGILPTCLVPGCFHNRIRLQNPFFLTDMRKTNLYLYMPNGWFMEFLKAFMPDWLWKKMLYYNVHGFNSKEMIDDFLSRVPEDYFAYFHIMETHPPFFDGTDTELPKREGVMNVRKRAVEYVDKIIKPLIDLDCNLIVTSDHNLAHGPRDWETGLDVFLATRGKFPMSEG